jgi:DUF4097 and DUF4098 domain-containing protein YvlB
MLTHRKSLLCSVLPLMAFLLAGCGVGGLNNRFTAEETEAKSFTTGDKARVVVETFNGSVEVRTGSARTVDAKVIKRAGGGSQDAADEDLDAILVSMKQEGDTVRIKASVTDKKLWTNRSARVELAVPPGAALELHTSNGKVKTSGPTGNVVAETSNGDVETKEATGPLTLTTSNGSITVAGGSGRLELHTSNGKIKVEETEGAVVNAHTSNSSIEFTGRLVDGEHSLRTSNGSIVLRLPADARFRVEAETSNGKITCDFPLKKNENRRKTQLRGSAGENPPARIQLHTSNGNITIQPQK